MSIQAIIRKSYTVSLTFTNRPSPELLQKLKAEGYKFESGNWYKTQSDSRLIAESEVAQHIAA